MDITNLIGRKIYGKTIVYMSAIAKDKSQLVYTADGIKILIYRKNPWESPYYILCDIVVKQSDFLLNAYGFNR